MWPLVGAICARWLRCSHVPCRPALLVSFPPSFIHSHQWPVAPRACLLSCAARHTAPYSALAKRFVRKWLAGYAFDPEKQVLRAYLSTLKPKPPRVQGE